MPRLVPNNSSAEDIGPTTTCAARNHRKRHKEVGQVAKCHYFVGETRCSSIDGLTHSLCVVVVRQKSALEEISVKVSYELPGYLQPSRAPGNKFLFHSIWISKQPALFRGKDFCSDRPWWFHRNLAGKKIASCRSSMAPG